MLVESNLCFGLLSGYSTPRGTLYMRFCSKCTICETRSHQASKLCSKLQRPGCYLASGTSRQGNILEVSFPLFEDGGPILEPATLHLLDPDHPFWMSFGQWLFVHAKWLSQCIESLSSEDTLESPSSLEVAGKVDFCIFCIQ
jgi:hypothetical protein